ncbi:hypothetical protein H4R33_002918 [Dimargaris cristalligena]|nr:hypothetical protein H4R33_002918 [Dimargaris cristalligena]
MGSPPLEEYLLQNSFDILCGRKSLDCAQPHTPKSRVIDEENMCRIEVTLPGVPKDKITLEWDPIGTLIVKGVPRFVSPKPEPKPTGAINLVLDAPEADHNAEKIHTAETMSPGVSEESLIGRVDCFNGNIDGALKEPDQGSPLKTTSERPISPPKGTGVSSANSRRLEGQFKLPMRARIADIVAQYSDGLLVIYIPKYSSSMRRPIAIT